MIISEKSSIEFIIERKMKYISLIYMYIQEFKQLLIVKEYSLSMLFEGEKYIWHNKSKIK